MERFVRSDSLAICPHLSKIELCGHETVTPVLEEVSTLVPAAACIPVPAVEPTLDQMEGFIQDLAVDATPVPAVVYTRVPAADFILVQEADFILGQVADYTRVRAVDCIRVPQLSLTEVTGLPARFFSGISATMAMTNSSAC
jgi:hypothetical protein